LLEGRIPNPFRRRRKSQRWLFDALRPVLKKEKAFTFCYVAPLLLAIGGHTGTGKSSLAHRLSAAVPFLREALVMDMDQVRREVLGYDLRVVMKPEDYSDEVTGRVRDLMNGESRRLLAQVET
jgi:adenylylsulfate kinase-like enzyme